MEVAQRILDQHLKDETPADFARRIGVSAQKLGNWKENGSWRARGGVELSTILDVHHATGWSLHWIMTGQGTANDPAPDSDAYLAGLRDGLDEVRAASDRITVRLERAAAERAGQTTEAVRQAEDPAPSTHRRGGASGRGRRRPSGG